MARSHYLYEHREDPSVLIVARVLDTGEYECRRYGETDTFVLDAETFLSIYQRRRGDRA